jgi:hypothetical protein
VVPIRLTVAIPVRISVVIRYEEECAALRMPGATDDVAVTKAGAQRGEYGAIRLVDAICLGAAGLTVDDEQRARRQGHAVQGEIHERHVDVEVVGLLPRARNGSHEYSSPRVAIEGGAGPRVCPDQVGPWIVGGGNEAIQ